MKLGTHNSMTYLKPKKWYMYPFRFIAKCQKVDIKKQYELGARMFDIRIHYDKNGNPEFRHGFMAFKGDVEGVFKYLNNKKAKCYIRLVLEAINDKGIKEQEDFFIRDCKRWESTYSRLNFFCGCRKLDWKKVYNFSTPEPKINQLVSSTTWKKIDDWYPWLYAVLMNKKNLANYNSTDWLLIDFIEIK